MHYQKQTTFQLSGFVIGCFLSVVTKQQNAEPEENYNWKLTSAFCTQFSSSSSSPAPLALLFRCGAGWWRQLIITSMWQTSSGCLAKVVIFTRLLFLPTQPTSLGSGCSSALAGVCQPVLVCLPVLVQPFSLTIKCWCFVMPLGVSYKDRTFFFLIDIFCQTILYNMSYNAFQKQIFSL